jgi:hypothetical protein
MRFLLAALALIVTSNIYAENDLAAEIKLIKVKMI